MVAYVALGPAAAVLAERVPRRALLVSMDVTRAGVALALPFVTQAWQIYVLVVSVVLPKPKPVERSGSVYAKAGFGAKLYWATPRLRALLALDLAVAAAGAMAFVNSVVLVREHFDRSAGAVSLTLGAYGAGSMLTRLAMPPLLRRVRDRQVMLPAAFTLPAITAAVAGVSTGSRRSPPSCSATLTCPALRRTYQGSNTDTAM